MKSLDLDEQELVEKLELLTDHGNVHPFGRRHDSWVLNPII